MATMYSNGTPDVYYEGDGACIWIEYKYYSKKLPKILDLIGKGKLSVKQAIWLERAHNNNQKVAVIVGGTPTGGVILEGLNWKGEHISAELDPLLNDKEICSWIAEQVHAGR